jgi:hypothetical protein
VVTEVGTWSRPPRSCPAGPTVGEYGGLATCGFGLAVPAYSVGWSSRQPGQGR